ncbi:MAG: LytR/AlgR family response regulator transcription factor [Saprospiraceae bacterium]
MEALKILIIEDDVFLGTELEEQLLEFGYTITERVRDSESAIIAFRRRLPDIVLCDIHLEDSELDGIDLVKVLNTIAKVPIIFLTAFSDTKTVARAKEVNPAYYLIKPCNPNQLQISLDFAIANFINKEEAELEHSLKPQKEITPSLHADADYFFLKDGHKYVRVKVKDILWVEALGANVKIITENSTFTLSANLSSFSKQVPHDFLVRVHRSYMINIHRIESFYGNRIYIQKNGVQQEIPIGKTYREDFQRLVVKLSSD